MNILVTGALGQLGREFQLIAKSFNDRYYFADIVSDRSVDILNIINYDDVKKYVEEKSIDIIINCAAYTNVDAAEDDPVNADLINRVGVGVLARVMKEKNGLLIHFSTDYVFGGKLYNIPQTEEAVAHPIGIYGASKLSGEKVIIESKCKYLIFRTSWLYSEFGKNFLLTMLGLLKSRLELNVVFDQVGTPTYAADLAMAVFEIIKNRKFENNEGIYNYSNEGVCSWFDFTKMIAEYSNNKKCKVNPCHSDEYPSKVKRPSYSVLDKTKFKKTFDLKIPYWVDSLKTCLEKISKN